MRSAPTPHRSSAARACRRVLGAWDSARRQRHAWLTASIICLLAGGWWAGSARAQPVADPPGAATAPGVPAAAQPVSAAAPLDYRIARGDELDLRFYFTPELNTRAIVRSDGRISVPLIGEVAAENLTVAELSAQIERALSPQVRRAQVAINVQGSTSLRIFVGGEVTKPGMQPLTGPLTALQAVMVAEGMKDTAQPSMALVLRRDAKGSRQVLPVDLDAAMKGDARHADLVLQPFDVVVVPRSGIADIGRWVDLYIRRTLPISFGVSYSVDRTGVVR